MRFPCQIFNRKTMLRLLLSSSSYGLVLNTPQNSILDFNLIRDTHDLDKVQVTKVKIATDYSDTIFSCVTENHIKVTY